jgi:short-chain Z-isoprenyl diphosphate synthase
MTHWNLLYDVYERRLRAELEGSPIPRHVGVILDGNRRWARATGTTASHGHRAGAGKIEEFLEWAEEAGVEIVTLWLLSPDNIVGRDPEELAELNEIIARTVSDLAGRRRWRLRMVGDMSLLDPELSARLQHSAADSADVDGMSVNVAVGYGGRHEIADAVRSYLSEAVAKGQTLEEVALTLTDSDITDHLYTKGQPDPDLVIRTSGEQRLSGFMMWQSEHSEFYFCEAYWPDFRRIDFLRALRSYGQRERRMGR